MSNIDNQKNRIMNKIRQSSGINKVSDFGKSKANQPPPPGSKTVTQTPKKKKDCGCRRKRKGR